MKSAIRDRFLAGEVDSTSAVAREFNVPRATIRSWVTREDWPTPGRVEIRKGDILGEVGRLGKIHRPEGLTACDMVAIEHLEKEGLIIAVSEELAPPEERLQQLSQKGDAPAPGTGDAGKKGKRVAEGFRGRKSMKMSELSRVDDSSKNIDSIDTSESSENGSPPALPARPPAPAQQGPDVLQRLEMETHDKQVAEIARKAIKRAHKLGTIHITKVSELRAMDMLYRTATGQTSKDGGGRPLININLLGQVGSGALPQRQESVRDSDPVSPQLASSRGEEAGA